MLLVALLCNDRAEPLGAEPDGAETDGAAHAVVWLAQLAKRQQCEEEPLKVGVVMVVRYCKGIIFGSFWVPYR